MASLRSKNHLFSDATTRSYNFVGANLDVNYEQEQWSIDFSLDSEMVR